MIDFSIAGNKTKLEAVWYHYKNESQSDYSYSLSIGLNEVEVIKCIENYAECTIDSEDISSRIIDKDIKKGSMGLIWNLFLLFKKQKRLIDMECKVMWTINNVRKVQKVDQCFIISGGASKNELENTSFEKI